MKTLINRHRWFLPCLAAMWPFCVGALSAATVGWKVPLNRMQPEFFEKDGKARKLAEAPGASVYFQPGDELWDLSQCFSWKAVEVDFSEPGADPFASVDGGGKMVSTGPALEWSGEWIVWNARSGMVIAKGARNEILRVERMLDLDMEPRQMRTKLEQVLNGTEEAPQELSLLSRNSEKVAFSGEQWNVSLESTGSSWPSASLNLNLDADGREPEGDRWKVETKTPLLDGERTLIAQSGIWQLWVTSTVELVDGTPLAQLRSEEVDGAIRFKSYRHDEEWPRRAKLAAGGSIDWMPATAGWLSKEEWKALSGQKWIEAPETLKEELHGKFLDVMPYLLSRNPDAGKSVIFAGYDPVAGWRAIVSKPGGRSEDDEGADEGHFDPAVRITVETSREAGGWLLASQSGETATCWVRRGETEMTFEVTATPTPTWLEAEVSYKLDTPTKQRIEGTVLLPKDASTRVGATKEGQGAETPVEMTLRWKKILR